jgi:hydroxyacylglutathione hydrolase
MFDIEVIEVTPFFQNTRVLIPRGGRDAVVVDPGGDVDKILSLLETRGATCREIWLTHSHLDHCGGVAGLKQATGALLRAHEGERLMRSKVVEIATMYGVSTAGMENCPEPDISLTEGDTLTFGEDQFEVLFTPGHSPGHLCFYHAESHTLIAGDTLFHGSIGRTDLPGGDHATLMRSIKEKILTLPDDTKVLAGHGPDTTVGRERVHNPFLNDE